MNLYPSTYWEVLICDQKKQQDESESDNSEDDEEDEDAEDSEADSDDPTAQLIKSERGAAAARIKEERIAARRAQRKEKRHMVRKRQHKEVNLNEMSSLTGRRDIRPNISCYSCGGPHRRSECPNEAKRENKRRFEGDHNSGRQKAQRWK